MKRTTLTAMIAAASMSVTHSAYGEFVQWKVEDGGNGHWYKAVKVPDGIRWDEANTAALRANAKSHLATITSAAENNFVFDLVDDDPDFWAQQFPGANALGPWLGGVQIEGAQEPDGGWRWVTNDEAFDFTNWGPGEPNNSGGDEAFLHFWGISGIAPTWNDTRIDGNFPPALLGMRGYIIETVPLPAALPLLGSALAGLGFIGWRKKRTGAQA